MDITWTPEQKLTDELTTAVQTLQAFLTKYTGTGPVTEDAFVSDLKSLDSVKAAIDSAIDDAILNGVKKSWGV